MQNVQTAARFGPATSGVNQALGIWFSAVEALQLINLGYSFTDTTGKVNSITPQAGYSVYGVQSRIAVIEGKYQGDVSAFTLDTDLSGYRVIADFHTNDQGPAMFSFSTDSDATTSGRGLGMTVLIAVPVVTPDPSGNAAPFTPRWLIKLFNSGRPGGFSTMGGGGARGGSGGAGGGSGSGGTSSGTGSTGGTSGFGGGIYGGRTRPIQ